MRTCSLSAGFCFLTLLLVRPPVVAEEPFPVRVLRNGARIKDQDRVLGRAGQDMLLWVTRQSPDQQWAYVKVPATDRTGWISVADVENIRIPAGQRQTWEDAHGYLPQWQELVDAQLYSEAAELAEQSASQMQAALQESIGAVYPGYPPAATALNQAGVARLRADQVAAAVELLQRACQIAEASLGTRHPDTCLYAANLGDALARSGQFAKAILKFDAVLPVLEQQADQRVSLAGYLVRYGTALAEQQRIFDARIAFGKARRAVTARHGERSREVAHVQTQFARAMDRAGQHQTAVAQLQAALVIYREIVDAEDPLMIDTLNRLSASAARAGDFDSAQKWAQEAVTIQRRMVDAAAFPLASSLNNLGLALTSTDPSRARGVLEESLPLMESAAGADSFAASFVLKNLGRLQLEQTQYDQAQRTFQRVLQIRERTKGAADISLCEVRRLLADVDIAREDFDSARRHLHEGVRIQAAVAGVDHPSTRGDVRALRQLIDRTDGVHAELDALLADSRRRMRLQIRQDFPRTDYRLDRIAAEYRLQRILAGRQKLEPETQFFALEITAAAASIRTGEPVPKSLPAGTVVYAFRAQGDQALIKLPGEDTLGWVGQGSVTEIQYSPPLLEKLADADARLDLGLEQHLEGNNQQALQNIRAALQVFDTELGEDSAPAAAARFTLGGVLAGAGDVRLAVEECRKAEAALADLLGESHFETAKARNNLADALLSSGKPAEALRPAAQALQTASGFGDRQREFQAKVAGNVGLALLALTHYEAAREYFDYALKLSLTASGEDHFGTARCYLHLGRLHTQLKEFAEAESSFQKAYRIAERVAGPASADTTRAMVRYGRSLIASQKIAEGRRLIDEAARINLRERGPMDVSTIRSDAAVASVALSVADGRAARTMLESVVQRATRRLGDAHPEVLQYQMLLADALYLDGQAERALTRAQDVSDRLRTSFDETTRETIDAFRAVGVYSAALGRLDVARMNYERALRLAQQVLGPDHPDTSACLLNIGEVALMAKDYVAARPRIEAAIDGLQQERMATGTAACLARTMLGYIDVSQGDTRAAVDAFQLAARDTFSLMSTVLPALSEKEQLLFLQEDLREMQDAWMSLPVVQQSSRAAAAAAVWHLNMKASSHELLATQTRLARDSSDVENREAFEALIAVREKLARLSLRTVPPDARVAHREAIARLTGEEERLSRELGDAASRLSEARQWIVADTIRAALSENSVLVNFARIRNANFAYSSETTKWKGERYVAFVIPPPGGEIVAIDLGLAEPIDRHIAAARTAVHSPETLAALRTDGEQKAAGTANVALQSLSAQVLAPLLPHVRDFRQLVLSPDGQLWTIPWAALPLPDGRHAIEQYQIRLAVSGRELLTEVHSPSVETQPSAPLIVADPGFDRSPGVSVALNEGPTLRTRTAVTRFGEQFRQVKRLPGTATEAAAIRDSVARFAGAAPSMFLQNAATETAVKSARSPQTLVLSTHGFFFEAPRRYQANARGQTAVVPQNPLLRCGLLLAGCHYADQASDGEDDGILTGMEIIGTDLRQTELVVLSACETGLGDVRSGEGVAGLRQAFQLAGAQSVVASLWQVEDRATARLMNDFFQNLAAGMTKSEALRQAQLQRIRSRRERNGAAHPFFWAAFTLSGRD
ncbi:MAG: CHAT domain-containing protein [Planctomycetaceae bacterium]|nr:CHAT domain-containing protein [Planctomycetaceae bacterium]